MTDLPDQHAADALPYAAAAPPAPETEPVAQPAPRPAATVYSAEWPKITHMGYQLVDGILTGMKQMWDNIAAWFAQWPQMILDAIGSIDIGSLFQWPDVGALFGGGGEPEKKNWGTLTGPAIDGASGRARGGNMWAGSTYRINEEGEEFFSPKSSVFAHKAGEVPGAGGGGGGVTIGALNIYEANDPAETARQVKAELRGLLRGAHSDSMARA